jgi:hypothetical protein
MQYFRIEVETKFEKILHCGFFSSFFFFFFAKFGFRFGFLHNFLENLKGKQKKTLHLLHSSCKKKYEKISPKNA